MELNKLKYRLIGWLRERLGYVVSEGHGEGVDEEKTIIEIHKAFAKCRRKNRFITSVTITPCRIIYEYIEIRKFKTTKKKE